MSKPPVKQQPSMQAILDRDAAKDAEHFFRPLPPQEAMKGVDQGPSKASPADWLLARDVQEKRGGRLAAIHGDLLATSSVSPLHRTAAIEAFVYSKGKSSQELTEAEKEHVVALSGIEAPPPLPYKEPKKKGLSSWWPKGKGWFFFK
jgi:hypothetical protein